jgi:hypothetical protein
MEPTERDRCAEFTRRVAAMTADEIASQAERILDDAQDVLVGRERVVVQFIRGPTRPPRIVDDPTV